MADSVGCSSVPAVAPSFAAMAVRRRFIMVRTRVRLARLTSARTWDCRARLMTEGLRFFTLVVAPCAIQNLLFLLCGRGHRSQPAKCDGITLSEAHLFVNEPGAEAGGAPALQIRRDAASESAGKCVQR